MECGDTEVSQGRADTMSGADDLWNELSPEEQKQIIFERNHNTQIMLVQSEEDYIAVNLNLIEICKRIIKRKVVAEPYTDKDKEMVELALSVINGCKAEIKRSKEEIRLLIKYPVGSKARPYLLLRKELK